MELMRKQKELLLNDKLASTADLKSVRYNKSYLDEENSFAQSYVNYKPQSAGSVQQAQVLSNESRVSNDSQNSNGGISQFSAGGYYNNYSNYDTPATASYNYIENQHYEQEQYLKQQEQKQKELADQKKKDAKENFKKLEKTYNVAEVKPVAKLYGGNALKNPNDLDMFYFEKFYQEDAMRRRLEFQPANLDTESIQFIDPFNADVFKDEIIDIDFGAIDAFTEALNAQIKSTKNGTKMPDNLQFPSNIVKSNQANFIDHQIILGDSSYVTTSKNNNNNNQSGNFYSSNNVSQVNSSYNLDNQSKNNATNGVTDKFQKYYDSLAYNTTAQQSSNNSIYDYNSYLNNQNTYNNSSYNFNNSLGR